LENSRSSLESRTASQLCQQSVETNENQVLNARVPQCSDLDDFQIFTPSRKLFRNSSVRKSRKLDGSNFTIPQVLGSPDRKTNPKFLDDQFAELKGPLKSQSMQDSSFLWDSSIFTRQEMQEKSDDDTCRSIGTKSSYASYQNPGSFVKTFSHLIDEDLESELGARTPLSSKLGSKKLIKRSVSRKSIKLDASNFLTHDFEKMHQTHDIECPVKRNAPSDDAQLAFRTDAAHVVAQERSMGPISPEAMDSLHLENDESRENTHVQFPSFSGSDSGNESTQRHSKKLLKRSLSRKSIKLDASNFLSHDFDSAVEYHENNKNVLECNSSNLSSCSLGNVFDSQAFMDGNDVPVSVVSLSAEDMLETLKDESCENHDVRYSLDVASILSENREDSTTEPLHDDKSDVTAENQSAVAINLVDYSSTSISSPPDLKHDLQSHLFGTQMLHVDGEWKLSQNSICLEDFKLPVKTFQHLYDHQKDCLKWLWNLHQTAPGGILAVSCLFCLNQRHRMIWVGPFYGMQI